MRDYVIVTDSCCDFDRELIQSLDLTVIPLSVQLGADRFRNTPEEAPESHVFYTRLKQGEPAQTSAPNVEEFKQVFLPFLQQGKDVLYLGFSSALSGTYHNAAIAAQELAEEIDQAKVTAVDTLCASMGQGLLVDLAVQEKRKGKSLEEVRDFVLATMPRSCAGAAACLRARPLWATCSTSSPSSTWTTRGAWFPWSRPRAGKSPWRRCSSTWRRRSSIPKPSASTSATETAWRTPRPWPP